MLNKHTVILLALSSLPLLQAAPGSLEELAIAESDAGSYGGTLIIGQKAEPKTLNPVTALDAPSRDIIRRMTADLISIRRDTKAIEPALAKSWTTSKDGRVYTLQLRRGLRFSDGHPFDADDVIFTFQLYLDEKIHSPQRDLLTIAGKPILVRKIDPFTVRFELSQPYAAAERIFDSIAILPKHLLEPAYLNGSLNLAWSLNSAPAAIAGLGPFQLKEYRPGERIVLQRNPYYWKKDRKGNRLPYLDKLEFRFTGGEDAQILQFVSGGTDVLNRVSAKSFSALLKEKSTQGDKLVDLGPGLEYNFLFFNLGPVDPIKNPSVAGKQIWFRQTAFRLALSEAIDRDAIVQLVYGGRGTPIWGHVTPGNKAWRNESIPKPARSVPRARERLSAAGFRWNNQGRLLDSNGNLVEFSIIASASNAERLQMATIIQDDLKALGIRVQVVSLEFRALLDRVLNTRDYEASLLGLGSGDVDPNPEINVWLSSGASHLWNPEQKQPATPWEAEIDQLMRRQMIELDRNKRKILYDRLQQVAAEQLPLICLASPNILVAGRKSIGNFRPSIMDHYTLWNVDQLYFKYPR
ncbi:MAG: ABC transporter substrate-binding protein [Bryobacteraceae bacterium]